MAYTLANSQHPLILMYAYVSLFIFVVSTYVGNSKF